MFQDFQLAPTLEEYECILGLSLVERQPYLYQGNYPSWEKVVTMLKVSKSELAKKRLRRNDIEGIPRAYLKKRVQHLSEVGDWETFTDRPQMVLCENLERSRMGPDSEKLLRQNHSLVPHMEQERRSNPTMWVFSNIPLMGTQRCINYNPTISLRQSGYPIAHPPKEELLKPLLVHGLGPTNVGMLRNIRQAWGQISRKGREIGPRCHGAFISYRSWLH
ncbi:hypothetical protein CR513_26255, partial [Mucuna pruriens]